MTISLQPEYIGTVFGIPVTNTFATDLCVSLVLIVGSISFFFFRKKHRNILFNAMRVLTFEMLRLTDAVTRNRVLSKKIVPLIITLFLYIISANLFALIPGFLGSFYVETPDGYVPLMRSPNSDLTATLALAFFAVCAIQFFSLQALGVKAYIKRFINITGITAFILGLFEIVSEIIKILSFAFRLFGNIFAGEVLLLVITTLLPYIAPLPFMALEIFVGIVQAFIFAILTLTFIKATAQRHLQTG